jgi:hypothetical protein
MLKLMSSIPYQFGTSSTNHNKTQTMHRRLPRTVSLPDPKTKALIKAALSGNTELSSRHQQEGISLFMPFVSCGDPFFICSSHILLITLKFQNGDVSI